MERWKDGSWGEREDEFKVMTWGRSPPVQKVRREEKK